MPIDFSEFNEFNIEKIKEWEELDYSEEDIKRWREAGVLVDKLYEFKMKKLFIEYLQIKTQNELSLIKPFIDYDPICEAEQILKNSLNLDSSEEENK